MDGAEYAKLLAGSANSDRQTDVMLTGAVRFSLIYGAVPDLEIERQRIGALLGASRFSLRELETAPALALSRILFLQFTDVPRTLSDKALFEIAGYLASALQLVACEPDLGAPIFVEPDPRTQPITSPESAVIGLWCTSDAPAPADPHWALDAIRIPQAWQLTAARGEGVVVGQPDTGVATHDELEPGLVDLAKAGNIIEVGPPTDPLAAGEFNPGHGTATSSVVASRQAGRVLGPAPGAQLAPIRCTNSVVLFDGAPVAAAVNHARSVGCDVVTMSLGGFFSRPLQAAIGDAVDAGLIVLAASGNCVGFVVYPGSDPNVIAVAGVDEHDRPWKGTSSGTLVDISAPGENVYVAVRKPNDANVNTVGASQGTSFAVALTAGVAALWLSHHGKANVRSFASQHGTTVHALFRTAVQQSARRPSGWKSNKYGAGIVDAGKLIALKLDQIALVVPASISPVGTVESVNVLATSGGKVGGFDWGRHGAEASLLAAKAAIAARRSLIGFESVGVGALRPSSGLAETAPAILRKLYEDADLTGVGRMKPVSVRRIGRLMTLSAATGTGLESAASISVETAQHRLRGDLRQTLVDRMAETLEALPAESDDISEARKQAVVSAETALAKTAKVGAQARLSAQEHFALEALVSLKSRPALRIRGDGIDPDDPTLGDWDGTLFNTTDLSASISAVGRINLDGMHVGTGWVVAPGLIATNRHVVEAIAEEFATTSGSPMWVLSDSPSINFDATGVGAGKSFVIKAVVSVGPDRINETVNFRHLDMAILSVEDRNAAGMALPAPLPLLSNADLTTRGSEILVCGYPARPGVNTLRDPDTGQVRDDVIARLQKLFGFAYSVKYLSPGQIQADPGTLDGDQRSWVFGHDATTLGGNSGSCAIYLGEPMGVVGLHFGGGTLRANYAHGIESVKTSNVLPGNVLSGACWL